MSKTILLLIEEEYGYQSWFGLYHPEHYANIVARWNTMKGLNCCVPVDFVIPGARPYMGSKGYPVCLSKLDDYDIMRAHVHECDDSYLPGAKSTPDAENFEIEGRVYSREEVLTMLDESRVNRVASMKEMYPEEWGQSDADYARELLDAAKSKEWPNIP